MYIHFEDGNTHNQGITVIVACNKLYKLYCCLDLDLVRLEEFCKQKLAKVSKQ